MTPTKTRFWLGTAAVTLLVPSAVMSACTDDTAGPAPFVSDAGNVLDGTQGSSSTSSSGSTSSSSTSSSGSTSSSSTSGTVPGDAGADADAEIADADAATTADADAEIADADAATTADADAASEDAAADTGADAPADGGLCSGQTKTGVVVGFLSATQPALPITVEWVGCAPVAQAAAGAPFPTWSLDVGIGPEKSYFRATATGYYTTLTQFVSGEVLAQVPPAVVYVVKTIPAFDATKGHVVVSLNSVKAACGGTKAGSTVVATGHPEAVITYVDKFGAALGGAAMGTDGLAVVSNLDPLVSAELLPAITVNGGTCTVSTVPFFDRAPVVANTVSTFQAQAN